MNLKTKIKKVISILLAGAVSIMSLSTTIFAKNDIDISEKISLLMDQRDKVNVNLILNEKMGLEVNELKNELTEINKQLAQLGVETLTEQEIQERFGNKDGITPYMDVPTSDNVIWNSYRSTVSINGTNYDVQTITATP